MKSNFSIILFVAFFLYGCEQKNAAIQSELRRIETTAKDKNQPEYIRESAATFKKILAGEDNIPSRAWNRAKGKMTMQRNEATILTYVAFLRALEKQLPEVLPPVEAYDVMKSRMGKNEFVERHVAQTVVMMSNSIQNITLYNDPAADAEVQGVLKRLKEKHGVSETGKKILGLLNTVHGHGITERTQGFKPWELSESGHYH